MSTDQENLENLFKTSEPVYVQNTEGHTTEILRTTKGLVENNNNTHHESTLASIQNESTAHERTTQHTDAPTTHRVSEPTTYGVHEETHRPSTGPIHHESTSASIQHESTAHERTTQHIETTTTRREPEVITSSQIQRETTGNHLPTTEKDLLETTVNHHEVSTHRRTTQHIESTNGVHEETYAPSTGTIHRETTQNHLPSTEKELYVQEGESTRTSTIHHESTSGKAESTSDFRTTTHEFATHPVTTSKIEPEKTTDKLSEQTSTIKVDQTEGTLSPEELLITAAKPIDFETTDGMTEIPSTGCRYDTCKNNGTCDESGLCVCTSHWTGDDCSVPFNIVFFVLFFFSNF
jgi:hypothetical protein